MTAREQFEGHVNAHAACIKLGENIARNDAGINVQQMQCALQELNNEWLRLLSNQLLWLQANELDAGAKKTS